MIQKKNENHYLQLSYCCIAKRPNTAKIYLLSNAIKNNLHNMPQYYNTAIEITLIY